MKKILSVILLCSLGFSLVACGDGGVTSADTDAAAPSVGGGSEQTDSAPSSSEHVSDEGTRKDTTEIYDPTLAHKVIMDDSYRRILIADLNLCGADPEDIVMEDCIVWEWSTDDAKGASFYGKDIGMDEADLRYSSYWERDVVIFCGSSGWVGIVDYETKELLFEDKPGNGPHSVELLPNGDLMVACSGNGKGMGTVLCYPISEGKKTCYTVAELDSAHGICWDPSNEMAWVLGGSEIIGCMYVNGRMTEISGVGASLKRIGHGGGHDFVPVYGQPGKYWVSGDTIMLFDANTETITANFPRSEYYTGESVKGIAWFSDGTMVLTAHGQGGTGGYRSSELRFLYLGYTEGKVKLLTVKEWMIPHRDGSQTYKIHTLSKDYQ